MKRIGIIGCGVIVRFVHLKAILASNEAYISAFFSRSIESAEKMCKIYHKKIKILVKRATTDKEKKILTKALNSRVYTDLDAFFENVDLVDIATPPKYHMYYAKIAAERGKTIMCEKPTARTYLEVRETYPVIAKVPFYMLTQRLYDPAYNLGRKIIDSNKLGKITEFHGMIGNKNIFYVKNKIQFWDPKISGGGALLDLGPHIYSVFRNWFSKDYKLISVRDIGIETVKTSQKMFDQKDYSVQIDDKSLILVKFKHVSGAELQANFESYWGNSNLYPKGQKFGNFFEVKGEKAIMTFPHYSIGILLKKKPFLKMHTYYLIKYKDGSSEKISMPTPKRSSGAKFAFSAFIQRKPSKNPAWFADEMMIILDSGYLSHVRKKIEITPKMFLNFCKKFPLTAEPEEQNIKYINELFPISK